MAKAMSFKFKLLGSMLALGILPLLVLGSVIVALQLSLEAINSVMTQREGLGETGETYLVGPDKLMRSDSYLDPVHHTVKASFADPNIGSVDTIASQQALSGKTGTEIITDYNGNLVLSAYARFPLVVSIGRCWLKSTSPKPWDRFSIWKSRC